MWYDRGTRRFARERISGSKALERRGRSQRVRSRANAPGGAYSEMGPPMCGEEMLQEWRAPRSLNCRRRSLCGTVAATLSRDFKTG